jgi:hypothetical protein
MSHISTDILNVYNTYFQKPYYVGKSENTVATEPYKLVQQNAKMSNQINGIDITEKINGVEVFLPITLRSNTDMLKIACATIRVTNKKTIIRTAVSERMGTIKEQFQVGDYVFTIKGVLISETRGFPTQEVQKLKALFESRTSVYLDNAYAEQFMPGENRIAIESLEFPEQEGKHIRFRPFVLVCETDYVDTLEVAP